MNWLEQRWYSDKPAPGWLRPLEKLYLKLARHHAEKHRKNAWQAPVPVIVVGNISVGGTGKTPLVIYLVNELRKRGFTPGVISRGYKSKAPHYPYQIGEHSRVDEAGDEPYLIFQRCQCPAVIDRDRSAAAQQLLQNSDCDLIISDDGLQHYRLNRDIEIVVVDGKRGFGNGHCIPAGPLREKTTRLQQVDFIISNGAMVTQLPFGQEKMHQMTLSPIRFIRCIDPNDAQPLKYFNGQTAHGLAGIGNPSRFFRALRDQMGVKVIRHPMPDHHVYTLDDIVFDDTLPVLMTEKDAVKIKDLADQRHWYLEVSATLPDNFIFQLGERLKQLKEQKG